VTARADGDGHLRGYDLYGVCVWSEVDLGLGGVPRTERGVVGGAAEVCLRRGGERSVDGEPGSGVVIARREDADGSPFYTATADASGFRFRVHGRFDFVVSARLDDVRVDWDPSVEVSEAGVYFTGTVMAFLRSLAGLLTLHGSAVRSDGPGQGAVGFLGPSGSGKTTAAALALGAGFSLVSDDVLCVVPSTRPPLLAGGNDELRVRPEASWALDGLVGQPGVDTRRTADGRTAVFDHRARGLGDAGAVPLRLLVLPDPDRACREVEVVPVAPADALFVVASQPRLTGWVDHDVLAAQFTAIADLVESVPVVRARLPWATMDARAAVARLLGEAMSSG
jgi:hypothetical protein